MQELGTVAEGSASELTLEKALKMYDAAKKYTSTGLRTNWDNYFKVYKGERVVRNYEGISDPNIRESHTIIETLVANIAGGNPSFHFVATNEEQTGDTEILNGMLDYYMQCNHMGLKNQEWVRDMLLYGTGILHVTWRDGKPFIENIPLRDFFVDPTATGMVDTTNPARYAGFEYLADKEVLKQQMIYSAKENKMVPKYKNLDIIGVDTTVNQGGQADGDHGSMDKAFKDMFNGSTLGEDAVDSQVRVIIIYDLISEKIVEIGNKKAFIYYEDSHLQREASELPGEPVEVEGESIPTTKNLDEIEPFLPFAVLRDYVDTSLFYGEGEMAIIMGDAELLNDYESMDIDNNAYQNTPMYWIDPQFADLAPEIETIPGAVYPIPRNAMGALERPQLSGDLDNKKQRIQERMRAATAADEAVQGIAAGNSRTTATEVSTQIGQAQNRFSTKTSNLENEGYAQLAEIIYKMVQIFVTRTTAMRIVGKNGTEFKDYDPYEFNGKWEPHVELDTTIKRKLMEVGQKDNQVYLQLSEDPHGVFDPIEVKRFIVQHIDPSVTDERFNKMLAQPTPPQPNEGEMKMQADQAKAELAAVAEIYRWATPFVQSQIETILHMQPDPQHEIDENHNAVKIGAEQADLLNPQTDSKGNQDPSVPALPPPVDPNAQTPDGMSAAPAGTGDATPVSA
jgi:hypothetical protein